MSKLTWLSGLLSPTITSTIYVPFSVVIIWFLRFFSTTSFSKNFYFGDLEIFIVTKSIEKYSLTSVLIKCYLNGVLAQL